MIKISFEVSFNLEAVALIEVDGYKFILRNGKEFKIDGLLPGVEFAELDINYFIEVINQIKSRERMKKFVTENERQELEELVDRLVE